MCKVNGFKVGEEAVEYTRYSWRPLSLKRGTSLYHSRWYKLLSWAEAGSLHRHRFGRIAVACSKDGGSQNAEKGSSTHGRLSTEAIFQCNRQLMQTLFWTERHEDRDHCSAVQVIVVLRTGFTQDTRDSAG